MIQIHLYTKQTHRYRKHSYGYQRTGGKDKLDFEINGHILLNIKQTRTYLELYSLSCKKKMYNGKESEKEIHIYIYKRHMYMYMYINGITLLYT